MICYDCGTKAQRKETRVAKKEGRGPKTTIRCGTWRKGTCEKCKKKRIYVTEVTDFLLVG